MNRQGRTTRGRVLAAAAVAAALAMTALPALAAPPAPSGIQIQDGGDGFVNASEAAALQVTGAWDTEADPAIKEVFGRIVTSDTCADISGPGKATGLDTDVVLDGDGSFTLTFDVTGLEEGPLCARVRTRDTTNATSDVGFSLNIPILDLTPPSAKPAISTPAPGSLNGVDGGRRLLVAGSIAEPGATVRVTETEHGLVGSATADSSGAWSVRVALPTGTHTITAQGFDEAGNGGPLSDPVTFDLDADLPFALITTPPDLSPYLPGDEIIIEGIAQDTNGQAFGGLLAVEVNIHDPLVVGFGSHGQVLGVLQLGATIHQQNVDCPVPCTSGVTTVTWSYDASWLPTGTYTFQIRAFDKAGNQSIPGPDNTVRIIRL